MNKMKIIHPRHQHYSYVARVRCRCLHIDAHYWLVSLGIVNRIFNDSQRFLPRNANGVEYLNTYLNIVLPLISHRISTGFASFLAASLLRL